MKSLHIFILILFVTFFLTGCTNVTTLIKKGRFDEAEKYCQEQESKDTNQCFEKAAFAYFSIEEYQRAIKAFKRSNKPKEFYFSKVAGKYFENKDFDNAILYYEKAGKPKKWFLKNANSFLSKEQFETAIKFFKESGIPEKEYFLIIGKKLFAKEDYEKALYYLRKANKEKECVLLAGESRLKSDNEKIIHKYRKPKHMIISSAIFVMTNSDKYIASGGFYDKIDLFDIMTGAFLKKFVGIKGYVDSLAISQNNRYLVSGHRYGYLMIWDIKTGKLIGTFRPHSQTIEAIAISPDNKYIISVSRDKKVVLLELKTGKIEYVFRDHPDLVYAVKVFPKNDFFVTGGLKSTMKIYDLKNRKLVGNFDKVHQISVSALAVSDSYLVSAGYGGRITIRDIKTLESIEEIRGHSKRIESISISSDGRLLVSSGEDRKIKLWELPSGKFLEEFLGHSERVHSVGFSPDNQVIISAASDQTIRFWRIDKYSEAAKYFEMAGLDPVTIYKKLAIACIIDAIKPEQTSYKALPNLLEAFGSLEDMKRATKNVKSSILEIKLYKLRAKKLFLKAATYLRKAGDTERAVVAERLGKSL